MNHVGTISRDSRYHRVLRGLRYPVLACLLVASASAHATVNPDGLYVMSSTSTGVKTGQYIEAAASARYQPYFGSTKLYTKALVPVSTTTLRTGALAALGRGLMHPGLQVAVLAAGWIISETTGEILKETENPYYDYGTDAMRSSDILTGTHTYSAMGSSGATPFSAVTAFCAAASNCVDITKFNYLDSWENSEGFQWKRTDGAIMASTYFRGSAVNNGPVTIEPTITAPVAESDYPELDQHIPPQLYDELYNAGPVPEWQDEISILGAPASYVQPTGDQAVAPEVATKLGQWAANAQASIDGVTEPYPENDAPASTAEDELLSQLDLDGPIPPFPGTEPEWQVETIDAMPTWSAGIGEATCPPPTVITLWSGLSFELPFQPLCDFAGFIRAVVIASAGIASLFIVLGRSS